MKKLLLLFPFIIFGLQANAQCPALNGLVVDAVLVDPNGTTNNFDTDGDGIAENDDEFIQLCNTTGSDISLNGYTIDDPGSGSKSLDGAVVPANGCLIIITDYLNNNIVDAAPAPFFDLGLSAYINNGGDDITLNDGMGSTITINIDDANNSPDINNWDEQDGCLSTCNNNYTFDCSITPDDLDGTPLPVKLTHFNATLFGNDVKLNWTTASETNSSHFQIQYSTNGLSWSVLGEVAGAGTTNETQHYNYLHPNVSQLGANILYYRLGLVDFNGAFEYSSIRSVILKPDNDIKVLALGNMITINGINLTDFYVFDTTGRLVDGQTDVDPTTTNLTFNVTHLAKGMYFIQFVDGRTAKMVVQQ